MISRLICLLLFVLACPIGGGCSRQMVDSDNPVAISAEHYQNYFDTTIDVLREKGYVIDRRDYRFGTITTLPQGSPNIVEVWNDQNTTADQAIESTLASEQRRVEVQFAKGEAQGADPQGYHIEVRVILERKQVPTRRLAGSAQRNVFSDMSAPPRELRDRAVGGAYWEPVGRDELLEARLMKMIRQRVAAAE